VKRYLIILLGLAFLVTACDNASNPESNGQIDPEDITNSNPHTASNESGKEMKGLPQIKWEKTKHNFGRVEKGSKVMYMFKFTNVGDADLIILDAKASCGCTVPKLPEEPIAPGESEQIKVEFSGRSNGNFNKSINVTANTVPKLHGLNITGEVFEVSEE